MAAWRAGAALGLAGVLGAGVVSPAAASVSTSGCVAVDEACTLAELVSGGRIDVNEQRFEGFEIERQTRPIDLAQIRVSGLDADLQQAGLLVSSGNEWHVQAGDFLGVRIGYRVRSLVSGAATAGSSLDLVTPEAIDGGTLRVDQTAYDAQGRRLGSADGELDSAFETARLSDSLAWSEQVEILGETDVILDAGSATGEANLGGVEIRYALPEPGISGVVFVGAGLVALRCRRRALHLKLRQP